MAEEHGIWMYAVTRQLDPAVLGELRGVSGETPRIVESAGLAAVVGDVPLSGFGEEALRRNLEDLDWLAGVARAHDTVVGTVVARGPVVPIRLATVYRDDDRVRAVLRHRAPEFDRILDYVAGRTEWGVKVFVEAVPDTGSAEGSPSRRGAGTAYLARRKAALTAREQQERRSAGQAERVYSVLAARAVGACTHPPHSRTLTGTDTRMILNAAYLVDEDGARSFAAAVAECDQDNDAIRVQLTGPWPPYSFSSLEEP